MSDELSSQISSLINSQFSSQNLLLQQILDKLNNMEKTFVTINSDLINQNIKMSEIVHGKLKEPDFEMPSTSSNSGNQLNDNSQKNKEKELFYYESNGKIIVYGPGTFDNKPTLKQYGEWNSLNKSWDLIVDLSILLEKLPKIIKKEKNCLINNE